MRKSEKKDRITSKLLVPVISLVTVMSVVMIFMFRHYMVSSYNAEVQKRIDSEVQDFNSNIGRVSVKAANIATLCAGLPGVQEAYLNYYDTQDLEASAQFFKKEFININKEFQRNYGKLIEVHFHLPPARSFFRNWTDKRGDDLSGFRNSVLKISSTKKQVYGIEVGRSGFEVRGISPIFSADDSYLGSVEVLISMLDIVKASKNKETEEYALFMNKDLLPIATGLGTKTSDVNKENPIIGDFILVSKTSDNFQFSETNSELLKQGITQAYSIELDNYNYTVFPINDFSGASIGVGVYRLDISEFKSNFANMNITFIVIAISLLLIISIVIAIVSKRVLSIPIKIANQATLKAEKINNYQVAEAEKLTVALDQFQKGDLSFKLITNEGDSDTMAAKQLFDGIAIAVDNTVTSVKALVNDATMLSIAAVEGKLDTRADVSKHGGDFAKIVSGVNNTLDAVIGPLNVAAEYVDRISKGNIPTKITENYNGDFNTIKNNLNVCIDAINELVADANMLAVAAVEGKLNTRADASKHNGDFEKIITGVNNTLDAVIGPLNVAAEYMDLISKGDIPAKITDRYNGDFNNIKNNLNVCIDAVNALVSDANMLADAAVAGKLETRADTNKHSGDFEKIIRGVNNTLDAVIGPLNVAADYVARISVGDMPPVITDNYSGDFNNIKNNLNVLIDALNEVIQRAKLVANGDLTVELKKRHENDEFMQSLTDMVKATANIITEFQVAANNISASSKQMSATSQQMSQGATEQASSAEEVSSSMEEMAANIQQNTDNAQQTEKISLKASDGINNLSNAASETLKYMTEIADKVSIIGEIARQTNILALNAAVEAARAGEHGKGFAVVAAEVRKLAERSQVSAVEIDQLTKTSVKATEEAGALMSAIAPEIGKTAKLVQEIAAASIEQNSGADQVNNAIQQLNQVTQQNAAASEEMATSSEELASQAEQLLELISFFKLDNINKPTASSSLKMPAVAQAAPKIEFKNGNRNGENAHEGSRDTSAKKFNTSSSKGVHLTMGKDSLDSSYEKF